MRRKITIFGHITRHDLLAITIIHGYVEGKRKRGRPKSNWMNDNFEFYNLSLRQLLNIGKDECVDEVRNGESCCYHRCHVIPLRWRHHVTK